MFKKVLFQVLCMFNVEKWSEGKGFPYLLQMVTEAI